MGRSPRPPRGMTGPKNRLPAPWVLAGLVRSTPVGSSRGESCDSAARSVKILTQLADILRPAGARLRAPGGKTENSKRLIH